MGWQLTDIEALALAEIGDLEEALRRLDDKRQVKRTLGGGLLSKDAQKIIAIAEAVADHRQLHTGSPSDRVEYLRRLLEKQRDGERDATMAIESAERVELLIRQSQVSSKRARAFLRQVELLRMQQRNRLNIVLADPKARGAALERLDRVYEAHLGDFGNVEGP
jgi:hypothetical protein